MSDAHAIHEAFKRGDLEALRTLLDNPPDFPNCRGPHGVGEIILEYAIYWSPLAFVRTLLELGANANYQDHAGFPSLIAALSTERADKLEILELLISSGADVHDRGVNDCTPLHYAASLDDPHAIEILIRHGADPAARTTIDDYETPLELAVRYGKRAAERALHRPAL
jgi:ankyrin repeat protein